MVFALLEFFGIDDMHVIDEDGGAGAGGGVDLTDWAWVCIRDQVTKEKTGKLTCV